MFQIKRSGKFSNKNIPMLSVSYSAKWYEYKVKMLQVKPRKNNEIIYYIPKNLLQNLSYKNQ